MNNTILQDAKKRLIGKVIKYGSPYYPMKAIPTSIVTKEGGYLEVDYDLFISWNSEKWESGHYFVITKSKMRTLLNDGKVQYKAKDGAFVEIIL